MNTYRAILSLADDISHIKNEVEDVVGITCSLQHLLWGRVQVFLARLKHAQNHCFHYLVAVAVVQWNSFFLPGYISPWYNRNG